MQLTITCLIEVICDTSMSLNILIYAKIIFLTSIKILCLCCPRISETKTQFYLRLLILSPYNLMFNTLYQSSPKDETDLLKAVKNVHAMIDKEIEAGTNPNNVFVCGFSQGGLSFTLSCKFVHCY